MFRTLVVKIVLVEVVLVSVQMVLECTLVNYGSDGPEMYSEVFIGGFHGFYKLLRVSHHLQHHLGLVPHLQEHCCDIFHPVLV